MGYPHFKKPPYIYTYIYIYIIYSIQVPISPFRHGRGSPAPHLGTQLPYQVIGASPHIEILEGLESDTGTRSQSSTRGVDGRGRWLQKLGSMGKPPVICSFSEDTQPRVVASVCSQTASIVSIVAHASTKSGHAILKRWQKLLSQNLTPSFPSVRCCDGRDCGRGVIHRHDIQGSLASWSSTTFKKVILTMQGEGDCKQHVSQAIGMCGYLLLHLRNMVSINLPKSSNCLVNSLNIVKKYTIRIKRGLQGNPPTKWWRFSSLGKSSNSMGTPQATFDDTGGSTGLSMGYT